MLLLAARARLLVHGLGVEILLARLAGGTPFFRPFRNAAPGQAAMQDWLRERGWWAARGHGSRQQQPTEPTHLFLDGGVAYVPDDSNGTFLNEYAARVARGARICACERRTRVFRMFLDLDVRLLVPAAAAGACEGLGPRDLARLAGEVLACAAQFFADADAAGEVVVCSTQPKREGATGAAAAWR